MSKTTPESKVRLNLDITQSTMGRIRWIQQKSEAASATEVIRRALVLLEMVHNGDCVIMVKDMSREIRIL